MQNVKRYLPLIFPLVLSVVSCAPSAPETLTTLNIGDDVALLNGVKVDNSKVLFDDFTNGVSYDNWIIANGFWGQGNGGVISDNVFYTEEGELLLRGNGLYYAKEEVKGVGMLKDGRNTGAALISKFLCGPGRYEVKMKPLGRQGACTAFWTFSNQPVEGQENDNHEIDIELPGGKEEGVISFKNLLNTNYITETYMHSQDKSTTVTGEQIILNDGEYHTFGFDWYTNPGYIVYYLDGKVTSVSDHFIPSLQTRLWLGVWFPNNAGFVGQSYFETDYLTVDWVKYAPFDSTQPFTPFTPGLTVSALQENLYPSVPTVTPEINYAANGDFEYIRTKENINDFGWVYNRLNTEELPVSEVCYPENGSGYQGSAGAVIKHGGYLTQDIDSIYEGFKNKITFNAKTDGDDSTVLVSYFDPISTRPIKEEYINITKGDFEKYEYVTTAPEGAHYMRLEIYNTTPGSLTTMHVDNFKVVRVND